MPKININGITRAMDEQELAEYAAMQAEMPTPEPTPEERMQEIEAALIELAALLGGG